MNAYTITLFRGDEDGAPWTGAVPGLVDPPAAHHDLPTLLSHLNSAIVADLHGMPVRTLAANAKLPVSRKKANNEE